jgi:hypothetical protein
MRVHFSQSPRLMQIDPYLIKFNAANPRAHWGKELLRLKTSVEKVGMVQFPTVRDLYGDFVECLDGEGRVLIARENHEPRIWVVNLGKVHDTDALLMLQAANTVRTFSLLDECQGMANLHRQGETIQSLAEKFSLKFTKTRCMVDIGYFPDDLLALIREDEFRSEEHVQRWTYSLLVELLPLRQELPGKAPFHLQPHEQTLDDVYDYLEVRRAIEKVVRGDIAGARDDMRNYVTQRRLELFQALFDQKLQAHLKVELEQAKLALEQDYSQKLELVQQKTIKEYEEKLQDLQKDRDDLEASYKAAINKVAKESEQVKQIQEKLQLKIQDIERKRKEVEVLRRQMDKEAHAQEQQLRAKERQLEEEKQRQLEEELKLQRTIGHELRDQMKADLEAQYAQKERELQLQTETTIHQIVADCARLLTETQLSVLNLISPDVFKGISWLQRPEMMALIAQIRTVRETLEQAEERLLHGDVVPDSERRSHDGSRRQAYH